MSSNCTDESRASLSPSNSPSDEREPALVTNCFTYERNELDGSSEGDEEESVFRLCVGVCVYIHVSMYCRECTERERENFGEARGEGMCLRIAKQGQRGHQRQVGQQMRRLALERVRKIFR